MKITRSRPARVVLCATVVTGVLVAMAPSPAYAAGTVSQATAQAVHLDLGRLLTLAVSNPATSAANDGKHSNAEVTGQPLLSLLNDQQFVEAGALAEVAEANQDGSSYGCAGIVSPGGKVQVGNHGKSCSPTGNGTGGVTIDLGELPGLGLLSTLTGGLKLTADSLTAHGYQKGTDPAVLGASIVGLHVQVGNRQVLDLPISSEPNQDLLPVVLDAVVPQLGPLGQQVSNLLRGAVELTANYQPDTSTQASGAVHPLAAAAGDGDPSVSALHVELLGGTAASADLAKVTVGPNTASAPVDAFSFQNVPLILGGLALLVVLGYGVRFGTRRIRALV